MAENQNDVLVLYIALCFIEKYKKLKEETNNKRRRKAKSAIVLRIEF